MSILIKGMEIPSMMQAYAGLIIGWDCKVYPFIPPQGYELGECVATAVSVPPHGRLIDADALVGSMGNVEYKGAIKRVLMQAPTIIEAEEGEE